ncbi:hypothetical protein [Streptomyces litmocidini]|uniref:hypothetical protein n=1 Tax=Streptomyces litmocidini TaxID=67318 RepID=UPI0036F6F6CB
MKSTEKPDRRPVAPLPVGGHLDATVARRFTAGCRAVGADRILHLAPGDAPVAALCPTETDLSGVAPPVHRAWFRAADVVPGAASAQLLSLLDDFTGGRRTAADFAGGRREGRRAAQTNGERTGGALADRWGVDLGPVPRKTVWAELDLSRP